MDGCIAPEAANFHDRLMPLLVVFFFVYFHK